MVMCIQSLLARVLLLMAMVAISLLTLMVQSSAQVNPFAPDRGSGLGIVSPMPPATPVNAVAQTATSPLTAQPAAATAPQSNMPFDVSPEVLRQLQLSDDKEQADAFNELSIIAMTPQMALLKSNDQYLQVRHGGLFSFNGRRYLVDIRDQQIRIIGVNGSEVYTGFLGTGLTEDIAVNNDQRNLNRNSRSSSTRTNN